MNGPLLLDTTILIDHLRGRAEATALLKRLPAETLISVGTVLELFAGSQGEEDGQRLDRFIATFKVVPMTTELARAAGLLSHVHTHFRDDPIDAVIAATAQAYRATLLTSNIRHFRMLERVSQPYSTNRS